MGGATALNQLAIHKALDCYHVPYNEDRLELINKIETIANSCLRAQHEEAEVLRKAAQKR